jgi:hypothetical protein
VRGNSRCNSQNAIFRRFWQKLCYFVPDWDISTSKLSFHSTLHDERSARQFQLRTKPGNKQSAIFRRFWHKLCCFVPKWDISTFERAFRCGECSAYHFKRWDKLRSSQNAFFYRFSRKLTVISSLFEIFVRSNAPFAPHYTPNVVHATFRFVTSPATCKMQSFVDFDNNYLLFRSWLGYFDVRTRFSFHFTRRM